MREIARIRASRQPVLIGTASVSESESLADDLRRAGGECRVLNARNDEAEAAIIAAAGALDATTISTNMAGRGVDIRLGGADERDRDAVVALGGLRIIGTNRHESLRIDGQLRGSSSRARRSQSFATRQSRCTVARETPRTSAVSSLLRPPK